MKKLLIAAAFATAFVGFGSVLMPNTASAQCVEYHMVDLQGQVRERPMHRSRGSGYTLVFFSSQADARCLVESGVRYCVFGECPTWINTITRGAGRGPIKDVRHAANGKGFAMRVPRGVPILLPANLSGPVAACDTAVARAQDSWYLRRGSYASVLGKARVHQKAPQASAPARRYQAPPARAPAYRQQVQPKQQPCVECSVGHWLWSRN